MFENYCRMLNGGSAKEEADLRTIAPAVALAAAQRDPLLRELVNDIRSSDGERMSPLEAIRGAVANPLAAMRLLASDLRQSWGRGGSEFPEYS